MHSRQIYSTLARSLHVVPTRLVARTANQENMNWSTSVYTTLSSDTEPSIVITFESAKYIFNAGENTTRAILQSKRGWRKVKALFLTQLRTERLSGVPGRFPVSLSRVRYSHRCLGLFMSVADSSPRTMQIVGPRGILHFLASMRFYTFRFVWPPSFTRVTL